ncbi:MAG: c-type cytochrome [Planctomycetota bacterium]|nr:c-type cytochrome [Planctomycetota bacterium]
MFGPALRRLTSWFVPASMVALMSAGAVGQEAENAIPKSLGTFKHPEDNLSDPRKIALGKQLYFDPRLSADKTVSCATCHDPKHGWSDGRATSAGVGGQVGGRNAPTVINSAFHRFHFWDGRAATLEEQALGPIANPIEMNLPVEEAVKRLNEIEGYKKQFNEIFGGDVTKECLAKALAAYERTILSGDAPYDRFKAGDTSALSEPAVRGMKLFFGKANCSACHSGPNFTDFAFHNIGVGMDKPEPDKGRVVISELEGDTGAFKTPTLREVARSGPYMHDGGMKTLEEVVEYYAKGGTPNKYLDEEISKLNLTDQDKSDLVTFLKEGLSSDTYPMHEKPELPE